jgi:hypothetical protein
MMRCTTTDKDRMARILRSCLLFVSAASAFSLLPGCATTYTAYQDQSVSPSQVATITGERDDTSYKTVYIMKVDRQNVYGWWNFGNPSTRREVRVLAGKHDLRVKYMLGDTHAEGRLQLVAEAGRTYTVKADERGNRVCFWVAVDAGRRTEGNTTQEDDGSKSPQDPGRSATPKL